MLCKYCNTELGENVSACPGCGKPVALMNGQFENIIEVREALKSIVSEHGVELFRDSKRFTGLLNDYMPEYEKERRLIRNVISNDVISQMLNEPDQKLAIIKAREYMLNDMFLSAYAAEFVLDCFTYMLGWSFTPEIKEIPTMVTPTAPRSNKTNKTAQASSAAETSSNDSSKEIKQKPFRPFDALKYKLIPNVRIPEGYTSIKSFAFDGYGFLRSIKLPETIVSIDDYAFSECKRLRSIELPDSLRVIKKSAFSACGSLESVKIPYGVDAIQEGTFAFCQNLEDVEIPETVSSIGDEAFEGCETLRELRLPDSIKFIGANVFLYCPHITIVCHENSYVHKFCMTNSIHFEFIK
ncbi:MAG: leucine-rich repeat domain-containing protein [Ruminococcus sp.]|nr:leucine-rich repeat domain-containing protein [Ruminococcus sp.]